MLKVKIFDAEHEADLEEEINAFLATITEFQLQDIKFQVAAAEDADGGEAICCFSAMILYRE
ncbi:MAG TPA: sporulation protein Cse60 [Bacillales bacterium]|nr:sporulation protein Cse60 [Bacillales bacterium]